MQKNQSLDTGGKKSVFPVEGLNCNTFKQFYNRVNVILSISVNFVRT